MSQGPLDIKLQMAYPLIRANRLQEAEQLIRQILAQDPDHMHAASALAELFSKQHRYSEAIEVLDTARRKNPDDAETLTRLANMYRNWGKFDAAKECYRRAISLGPANTPRLHLLLATTCRISERDDDVRAMEAAYAGSAQNPPARRLLAFALGKVFDDLQQYDTAFAYFLEGNAIAAAASPEPDLDALVADCKRIRTTIGPEFVRRYADEGIADDTPIFVTGMPRSGTTLVEQVLASHPKVHGGGETGVLNRMLMNVSRTLSGAFPSGFDTVAASVYQQIARDFVSEIKRDEPHTTNKRLSSYIFFGWIRAFLPNAKIVLCRRDPRDIGISSFQLDLGRGFAWSYKLEWIGRYFRNFDDLTNYWLECFPGHIHVIHYEELIADPEPHIRSLLDYCNLEFAPACLESHKTVRVVTTSSRAQVREPIYNHSVGRWQNYATHLQPLIDIIEQRGS